MAEGFVQASRYSYRNRNENIERLTENSTELNQSMTALNENQGQLLDNTPDELPSDNNSNQVNEFTSLLPLYSDQTFASQTIPPTYLKMVLEFMWKFLIPEVLKLYLRSHTYLEIIIVISILLVVVLVLFYTGQIGLLPVYLKVLFCLLASWFDNLSFGLSC